MMMATNVGIPTYENGMVIRKGTLLLRGEVQIPTSARFHLSHRPHNLI